MVYKFLVNYTPLGFKMHFSKKNEKGIFAEPLVSYNMRQNL